MLKETHGRRTPLLSRLVVTGLVLAGAVVSSWPVGQAMVNTQATSSLARDYAAEIARIADEAPGTSERGATPQATSVPSLLDQQLLAAQTYNATLDEGVLRDPWGAGQVAYDAAHADYLAQLALTDAMARLTIPSLGLDLPVYHDADRASLERGAGHIYGTSLPVGGHNTHAAIAAHTGSASQTLFDRLPELRLGDEFLIEVSGRRLTYRVDRIVAVSPDDLGALAIVPGRDLVTLVTCTTSPGGNRYDERLLVRGSLVPGVDATQAAAAAQAGGAEPQAGMVGEVVTTPSAAVADFSLQPWMWPRVAVSAAAVLLLLAISVGWIRSDSRRRRVAPEPARRWP